jgi:hypothetical protein
MGATPALSSLWAIWLRSRLGGIQVPVIHDTLLLAQVQQELIAAQASRHTLVQAALQTALPLPKRHHPARKMALFGTAPLCHSP